jgi:hypothetical protein
MKMINTYGLCVLLAALPASAEAHQWSARTGQEHTWKGTLLAVNTQDKTVKGKSLFFSKTFHVGQSCAITVRDKDGAALAELGPGLKVKVRYQEANGVLVADGIVEEPLHYFGTVHAVDAKAGTVTMAEAPLRKPFRAPRTFGVPGDCRVIRRDGGRGTLADLKPGDLVAVTYDLQAGSPVAYRVEGRSVTFVGAVDAIDLSARTVKAKDMLVEKRFVLAHSCQIIGSGEQPGDLKELALGQKYLFTYQEVNGVNVVDRIAPAQPANATETASAR